MTLALYSLWSDPASSIVESINTLEAMLQNALTELAALKTQVGG